MNFIMKNKILITSIFILLLTSCASKDDEEREPAEVQLYNLAQDRINAKNYVGAVDSLSRIERFYPFGVYAEQARADLIYAHYMTGDFDSAYASSEKFIRLYPRNTNIDYALKLLKNFSKNWPKHERPETWIISKNQPDDIKKSNYIFKK